MVMDCRTWIRTWIWTDTNMDMNMDMNMDCRTRYGRGSQDRDMDMDYRTWIAGHGLQDMEE